MNDIEKVRKFAYSTTLERFWWDVDQDEIVKLIDKGLKDKGIHWIRGSEKWSWYTWTKWFKQNRDSFKNLNGNCGVLIEYSFYGLNYRVDFIISGLKGNKHSSVIIEMKEWQNINNSKNNRVVKTIVGDYDEMTHPSIQAITYKESIENNYACEGLGEIDISTCVLMYNDELKDSSKKALMNDKFKVPLDKAPIFFSDDSKNLSSYINERILTPSKNANEWFKNAKICYSPKRIEEFEKNISTLDKFLDNFNFGASQKITIDYIINNISNFDKNIFIVNGDPGSGKTIVALKILNILLSKGMPSKLVLPGTDFRVSFENLFKKIGLTVGEIQAGIKNKELAETLKDFDTFVIDEFHKILGAGGDSPMSNMELEDYFKMGKNFVIFMDENQVVHKKSGLGKQGLMTKILAKLEDEGFQIHSNKEYLSLGEQYRHNGAVEYPIWIDSALGLKASSNTIHKMSEKNKECDFEIKIISDPNEFIESYYQEIQNNNRASGNLSIRLLSTYYNNWTMELSSKEYESNGPISDFFVKDIKIGEHSFAWKPSLKIIERKASFKKNMEKWKKVKKELKTLGDDFVNNKEFGEQFVGYYNTVQGNEFDIVYVFVGNDLILKDGEIVFNQEWLAQKNVKRNHLWALSKGEKTKDYELKVKTNTKLLKRQLKVLMTRGRSKVVLHFLDKNMEQHFRNHLD